MRRAWARRRPKEIDEVWGIAKAYSTRVGAGPFPTELHDETGDRIREPGGEFGTTTGRPRRCGWLDLVALKYAVRVNGLTGARAHEARRAHGLRSARHRGALHRAPRTSSSRTSPTTSRWCTRRAPTSECCRAGKRTSVPPHTLDDLPKNARAYLDFVSDFLGVPIVLIGVGPARDQIIHTGASAGDRYLPAITPQVA